MKERTVKIGGILVGKDYPARIAMEIGTYFGKDLAQAKEYIDFGKEVGVDFLKTEILHDLSVIHDNTFTITYNTDFGPKTENYLELFRRKQVSLKEYKELIDYCQDRGLPVIASVYDMKGIDFLADMNAAAAKLASQNNTNRPLIEHCAKKGLPLVMDTGNSFFHEIATSVYWAENAGIKGLVLNHRPDGSPALPEMHNMRIIESHADAFGWPVGFSCHYGKDEMVYLSIGLGARLIEKPIYHKKCRDDIDTMFTLNYDNFREMVHKVRNCSSALGDGVRTKQIPFQLECRPCVVTTKDIPKKTPLSLDNVTFAWPMKGIPSSFWNEIEGYVAAKDLIKGKPINWGDIEK